jgi:hypothetical protein
MAIKCVMFFKLSINTLFLKDTDVKDLNSKFFQDILKEIYLDVTMYYCFTTI